VDSCEYIPASDIWGSGIILYRLIYKRHPFEREKNVLDIVKLLSWNIDFPETEEYPVELMDILKGLLNLVWEKKNDNKNNNNNK
jgi:serine/threonine protein kinase